MPESGTPEPRIILPATAVIRRYIKSLGAWISGRERVYLDLKWWIYLCDAAAGRPKCKEHLSILQLLRELVGRRMVICPASEPVLEEVFKTRSRQRRIELAKLVDELSSGVALQEPATLARIEWQEVVRDYFCPSELRDPPLVLAWTRIPWLLGVVVPRFDDLDPAVSEQLASDFFLLASDQITFRHMVEQLGDEYPETEVFPDDSAYQLKKSKECEQYAHQVTSWEEVYNSEVAGSVLEHQWIITDILRQVLDLPGSGVPRRDYLRQMLALPEELVGRFLVAMVLSDGCVAVPPGVRVHAGLHALRRKRKDYFRKGDFYDFGHARLAIPFCNLFATERALATNLRQRPLEVEKWSGCRVVSDAAELHRTLSALLK